MSERRKLEKTDTSSKSNPDNPSGEEIEEGEKVTSLSIEQVWGEFLRRKGRYLKKYGKRPTGVIIGQIEGGVIQQHRTYLERKNMIRREGRRLYVGNMWVILSEKTSMIAPFHVEKSQLEEANPYAKIIDSLEGESP